MIQVVKFNGDIKAIGYISDLLLLLASFKWNAGLRVKLHVTSDIVLLLYITGNVTAMAIASGSSYIQRPVDQSNRNQKCVTMPFISLFIII